MSTKRITLTGRVPVSIDTDAWPRLAKAYGSCGEYGPGMTPRPRHEYSSWWLVARQHADGRTIVYVVTDDSGAAWWRPLPVGCHDGGEMLPSGIDAAGIVDAIRRVGESCGVPDETIRAAIASMPQEVIE